MPLHVVPLALVHHQRFVCVTCFRNFPFFCVRGDGFVHVQAVICTNGTAQKTKVEFYVVPCGDFFTSFIPSWVNPEAEGLECCVMWHIVWLVSGNGQRCCTTVLCPRLGSWWDFSTGACVCRAQGIVCLSLASDIQVFPSDTWVIRRTLF